MNKLNVVILLFIQLLISCSENIEKKAFSALLNEPCMLLNYEQDNTKEGTYLTIENINKQDSSLIIKLPENFFINNSNLSNWFIGWGDEKPLYDSGVENLRAILHLDVKNNTLHLGEILRGSGFPKQKQRIVFWNKNPSGHINKIKKPIIDPTIWPEFAGKSISFSSIEYDNELNKWIMFVNECDTSKIQIYAAMSANLVDWEAANNGKPILTALDFQTCKWAGKDQTNTISQTPFVSDIIRFGNKWYLFLDGYSSDHKRHIGIATSERSLLGPYKIYENPVISPGSNGSWNEKACFYAKVEKYKNGFIMFYDGKNEDGDERIGCATSTDLINWTNTENNPVIDQHTGWRSSIGVSEPSFVEIRKDTILLMIAGAKKFKMGAWHHYVTKRMYLDVSGNVNDTQLGMYISTDNGKTFIAHNCNPVFTNDYSNVFENEHLGANFCLVKTDTMQYIFYQAKSSYDGLKYNILLRQKKQ